MQRIDNVCFLICINKQHVVLKTLILTFLTPLFLYLTVLTGDRIDPKVEPEFPYIALSLHGHVNTQDHLSVYS
ncbi:hypothetical protein AL542_12185 [Grimontia hollisae]|nr:hypothetical protein AL542_12185 [Grimontia hollisae]